MFSWRSLELSSFHFFPLFFLFYGSDFHLCVSWLTYPFFCFILSFLLVYFSFQLLFISNFLQIFQPFVKHLFHLLRLCLHSFSEIFEHLYRHYSEFFFRQVVCPPFTQLLFCVLSCSFIWNIVFCCLNLSFCVCSPTGCRIIVPLAFGVCPLVDRASLRGLCRPPGVKDWCLLTGGQSWILSLWWARLCQGVYLRDGCGLRKTLSCCLLMEWGCVPVLLVVRPGASQHWRLRLLSGATS